MNHIKYLEFHRLMKELQFVESDYQYQSEVMRISDGEFLKSVNIMLNQFPELDEIYHKSQNAFYKDMVLDTVDLIKEDVLEERQEIPEAKKLYRDIVKNTHPDKIQNPKLNELYIEATVAYESNDIITLYRVCSELKIDFDIPDDYIKKVRDKINSYKEMISFLENTYTYKWVRSDDSNRSKVVVEFIRSKIG